MRFIAATRIIPLHVNKSKTVARSLKDRLDYAMNAEKTENGELVSAYECSPETADEEYMQNKNLLEYVLDDIFLNGSAEEKKTFISQHEKEITALEQHLQNFNIGKNKTVEKSLCNIII